MKHNYKRLIIVAYRIPFKIEIKNEKPVLIQNSGGLVSAILSLSHKMKEEGIMDTEKKILWFGYSDTFFEDNSSENLSDDTFEVYPIQINPEINMPYYGGFCNSTIWPLFHYYPYLTKFENHYYEAFLQANELFYEQLKKILQPGDLVWVHDYQLMKLPALIRNDFPDISVGFFLHIPFPTYEVFRILPKEWKNEILNGLLGADLIGFHTSDYTNYFLQCVERELGYKTKNLQIFAGNRLVKAENFPIGIDYDRFHEMYHNPEVVHKRQTLLNDSSGKKILFSVDRLDYSKGLVHRLNGFEEFLTTYPEWRGKIVFYMVVVPSRDSILQYQDLKHELEETIGRINGKFGDFTWSPIVYLYRSLNFAELVAGYTSADIALITPIRDGMNLVAKEFVASRKDKKGILILSEMAGAATELNGALLINPFDKTATSSAIHQALIMSENEQSDRMDLMQYRVKTYNVFRWADEFILQLHDTKEKQKKVGTNMLTSKQLNEIQQKYKLANQRLILLDYDGTLVDIQNIPSKVIPSIEALNVVKKLAADMNNTVVIITGRDRDYISRWFGEMNVHIFAEHGSFFKEPNSTDWISLFSGDQSWKEEIKPILETYVEKANGSLLEEKVSSLAWHYRNVDPEYGFTVMRELLDSLKNRITPEMNIHVLDGKKVIEIKQNGCDKGSACKRMIQEKDCDFILSIGDDITDEDMFNSLPPDAYSFKVGYGLTHAKMNLHSPLDVIHLLGKLIQY
ncbi:MAG TPA: bifunctional alpha,alpha-trehalose-phosphate synthase (UDP-forming)/trehalose-phosphatase [Leptospiraceae bacterium]|nr:bifunctional alpha,alpha-trehalose-phosphate synthase (UDP-forming)/trehalose-phosphatase [Leptospiraceae bacterium]HRG73345.1 bifunctional alpha,alpha-trehalose-phosphate synthase (UDP-forming)/trehalose-phosphatase [Leptospiraceae bacterium]